MSNKKNGNQPQDKILCYTLANGQARAYVAKTNSMVSAARQTHSLSNVATAALGRTLTFTAILGVQMKGDGDRMSITIKGDGPLGSITTAAKSDGTVKGFLDNPQVELMLRADGKLNVGAAMGTQGRITVIKDLGLKEPYIGNVEIQTGELGEDFAYYLYTSEQQPSAVALGVLMKGGEVASAGGVILSPLPGCSEEVLKFLEHSVPLVSDVSALMDGNTAEEVGEILFYPVQHTLEETYYPKYLCDCSRGCLENVLMGLGEAELSDMIEKQGGAQITCHFCNNIYEFSKEELESYKQKS